MPPRARRPGPSRPAAVRCRYSDGRRRCTKNATIEDGLCRQHALELEAELDGSDLIDNIDRMLTQRGHQPIGEIVGGIFDNVINGVLGRLQQAAMPGSPPGPSSPPRSSSRASQRPPPSSPPRPPPQVDPTIRAREILGFEPTERLTTEIVRARKQALAKVFHPDKQGGSDAQMKRVNAAADALLAKLS